MKLYECVEPFTVILEDEFPEETAVEVGSIWETSDDEDDEITSDFVLRQEEYADDGGILVSWIEIDQDALSHYFVETEGLDE